MHMVNIYDGAREKELECVYCLSNVFVIGMTGLLFLTIYSIYNGV